MRETIYQIILYRDQKKGMHGAFAEFLLTNTPELEMNPE